MIGIYKITNLLNNKIYIGQSTDIKARWLSEKTRAFNLSSNSYDTPLSRAFRKYGLENFTFEVLECCNKNELDQKETYYIYYYNSLVPFGYNITDGGTSSRGHAVQLGYDMVCKIVQELKEDKLTQLELAVKYNVSKDTITDINLGHTWHNPLITYPIRNNASKKSFCIRCGKEITFGATYCNECKSFLQRKVERPSKEQLIEEIATSSFLAVGRKYGVSDKAIVKWCKAYELPTHKKEIIELYKNK